MNFKPLLLLLAISFASLASSQQEIVQSAGASAAQATPKDPGEFWRAATVALGYYVKIGQEQKFIVNGTAVVVSVSATKGCLLTARHMLVDPNNGSLTRVLWMRTSSKHGETVSPIPLELFDKAGRNIWQALPNNDLAIIPMPTAALRGGDVEAVNITQFVGRAADLFQGTHVLVLGYPQVFRKPDQTNAYSTSPIARSGVIAWTDPNDPLGKPFLVDANLYGGNSGGPVFLTGGPSNIYTGSRVFRSGGLTFIGIVSQGPVTTAPVIAGDGTVTRPNPQTGIPENEYAVVPYVGGIGVIEPASKARELIESVYGKISVGAALQTPPR